MLRTRTDVSYIYICMMCGISETVHTSSESQGYRADSSRQCVPLEITHSTGIWSATEETVPIDLLFVNMIALYQVQGDEREGRGCER